MSKRSHGTLFGNGVKIGTRNLVELMEDGAPAHQAVLTRKWLQDRKVKRFQGWPENSPDRNPIENLWGQVKHAQRLEHATSLPGLKKIARRVWRQVTPEYIHTLY